MLNGASKLKTTTRTQKTNAGFFVLFTFYLLLLTLPFFIGCSTEQKAVGLYVDAALLAEQNQNAQAVEKLNEAVELDRDFSLAYSLLGRIYRQLADYEKSADSFEKAAVLNPWSFSDFFNLGKVYQLMEKFRQAAAAYSRACQLRADHLEAHFNAANCYYRIEDFNSAVVYAKQAEQIAPEMIEIQRLLADVHQSRNDYEQAIAYYKRALEIDSNDTEVMVALAVSYLKTARNEPARELLSSVVQLDPENNDAYQYLGYCFLQLNARAMELYKQKKQPDSDDAGPAASLKADAEKAIAQAVESYNKAIEINEKDWQAYRGLGVAYMLKAINGKDDNPDNLRQQAIEQWRTSLQIEPNQPRRERLIRLIKKYSK